MARRSMNAPCQNSRSFGLRRARTARFISATRCRPFSITTWRQAADGRFLLRIEDIDLTRCTPEFEAGILRRSRLARVIAGKQPVRRQSEHLDCYQAGARPADRPGLVYPAFLTRGEIKAAVAAMKRTARPGRAIRTARRSIQATSGSSGATRSGQRMLAGGKPHAWRLDMDRAMAELDAPLTWQETGAGPDGETGRDCGRSGRLGRCRPVALGCAVELPSLRDDRRRAAGCDACGARAATSFMQPRCTGCCSACSDFPNPSTTITA